MFKAAKKYTTKNTNSIQKVSEDRDSKYDLGI